MKLIFITGMGVNFEFQNLYLYHKISQKFSVVLSQNSVAKTFLCRNILDIHRGGMPKHNKNQYFVSAVLLKM